MADTFAELSPALDSPCTDGAAVTPSDSVSLTTATRALWVGGAGNVAAVLLGGETVTLVGVLAGTLIPLRCTRVNATGTTATSLVALW